MSPPRSLFRNLILNTDSYKIGHWLQYPPGTETNVAYISSRGVSKELEMPDGEHDQVEIVHMGVQAYVKEYLLSDIHMGAILEAEELIESHLPNTFNKEGWIALKNNHMRLPLLITSLPEGTVVPVGTPQVQVHNVDPQFAWLTTYIETGLLRAVWYPSTVATISREAKKIILRYLKQTSDDPKGQIPFKLHDFGARGASSEETAQLGGAAHLVNFQGTDTLECLPAIRRWFGPKDICAGFTINASEHSTICTWGEEHEADAYRNMIAQFAKPGALFACVSDSYDIYNACRNIWGKELHDQLVTSGGVLVVRPDSGDPTIVVTECLEILGERFGFIVNAKGFKVLNYCRIIQGDGMNLRTIEQVLSWMTKFGWSADNIAFGMGGALLQKVNRDTFKYAMKVNATFRDDKWHDVYKCPTGDLSKHSIRGMIHDPRLELVYDGNKLVKEYDFHQIRERADVC